MRLLLSNEQNKIDCNTIYEDIIIKAINICLEEEGITDTSNFEVSITFVDNESIKNLNKEYRNIEKETDVLSFPQYESIKEINKLSEIICLGDIVISLEKAIEQAQEYNHSFERELIYLVVHSMYHLMGYDHIEENDKKIMRKKEELTMNKLKILR